MSPNLAARFPTAEVLAALPDAVRLDQPVAQTTWLCNGEIRTWSGPTYTVTSPMQLRGIDGALTPIILGHYPITTANESREALAAATAAYDNGRGAWPTASVATRIAAVEAFTRRMLAKRAEIVRLLLWEIGKSLADSEKEFDRTVVYMQQTIEALKELDNANSRFQTVEGTIAQIRRAPLGVVLCMGPFNYPLNETFTTLIPALIMGNVILFKPPKHGTLLFAPLLEAFAECFPNGVVNTVYGRGEEVVPPLLESGGVNVLAFIGSSKVAHKLKSLHPKSNRLRAVLGLDAKNAAIILPDADLELAVKECVSGALSFNGQRCTALKMLWVHASIADEFVRRFAASVDALTIGMPWEAGVNITPLAEPRKPGAIAEYIADAALHGARVMNAKGGEGGESAATLVKPAVVYPVNAQMRLWREEQFGPIVPIARYDEVEEALAYVRDSDFGQQVSVFGSNPVTMATLVDPLVNQVCRVNLNCQCQRGPDMYPFTGRKDSAEGTLSVADALRAFSIRTMVAAKATPQSKAMLAAMVEGQESAFVNTRYLF